MAGPPTERRQQRPTETNSRPSGQWCIHPQTTPLNYCHTANGPYFPGGFCNARRSLCATPGSTQSPPAGGACIAALGVALIGLWVAFACTPLVEASKATVAWPAACPHGLCPRTGRIIDYFYLWGLPPPNHNNSILSLVLLLSFPIRLLLFDI